MPRGAAAKPQTLSFDEALVRATAAAARRALELAAGKELYAFALYTSGESDFGYVCASANTEEALARAARGSDERLRSMRFNAPDWKHHDFDEGVSALELPEESGSGRDARIYASFAKALRGLDREGLFGTGSRRERVALVILCGDMSNKFLLRSLRALNPPAVAQNYLERFTPAPFLAKLGRIPPRRRAAILAALWESLALDLEGDSLTREARLAGADTVDLEDLIRAQRQASLEPVLKLIERHTEAPAWNAHGSPEWERVGAATAASALASAAAFVLPELGGKIPASTANRLRACLRRRLAADVRQKGPVATLAENLARVMHELWPRQFPPTVMNDSTNRLMNPEPYLR